MGYGWPTMRYVYGFSGMDDYGNVIIYGAWSARQNLLWMESGDVLI